jgi:integrase
MSIISRKGIRKGPHGKPRISYGYRFHFRNKLYKKFVGHTRALAVEAEKRERARLELQVWEGQYGPLKPTLTTWAEGLERYKVAKHAKRSLQWDLYHFAWWTDYFKAQKITYLQEISPEVIDRAKVALDAAGKTPATIQRYLSDLRTLCNLAIKRWKLLRENPVTAVDWPKARTKTFPIPTAAEIRHLLERCDPVLTPIVLVGIYTGLREGDVMRLTAEDLQERPGWIKGYGSKGGALVWLPITPDLQAALDGLGVIAGRLFRRPDGTPFRLFPRDRWNTVRAAAGLPTLRFHDLRHAVGQMLAEANVPQRTIQVYLGHADGRVTERYTRPKETGLKRAARTIAKQMGTPANRTTELTKHSSTT